MIYLFCPNTAVDFRITLDGFHVGGIFRSRESQSFLSGKSVNSSYCLRNMNVDHRSFIICGKLDEDLYEADGFASHGSRIFSVRGETRRNLTILDNGKLITHIQNTGYTVNKRFVTAVQSDLLRELKEGDFLIVSGSLPDGYREDYLGELVLESGKRGCKIFLDTDATVFSERQSIGKIEFIKPNAAEFRNIMKACGRDTVAQTIQFLFNTGLMNVIVSAGSKGVISFTSKNSRCYHACTRAAEGVEFESVGSGDAFVAAFAAQFQKDANFEMALRAGVSAGHANIYAIGPGRIGDRYDEFFRRSTVESIDFEKGIESVERFIND